VRILQSVPGPALLALGLVLASCAWAVPADPGLNAARRARHGATEAVVAAAGPLRETRGREDAGARAIYLQHCARCHEPFSPTHLSAADWPVYVRKYGPRAGLFGTERARVLRWLQAHAR
jgi:cytochrome c5